MTDQFYLDAIIILLLLAAFIWSWTGHCPTPHSNWPERFPDGRKERRLHNRFRLLLAVALSMLCGLCGWLALWL
jgi:hypothetical protein